MEETHEAVQGSRITSPNCVSTLGGDDGISTVKGGGKSCFPQSFHMEIILGVCPGPL